MAESRYLIRIRKSPIWKQLPDKLDYLYKKK
jgi:hypothetical protein